MAKAVNTPYLPVGITNKLQVSSRVSVKLQDTFYTFEFIEERYIPGHLIGEANMDLEKAALWDSAHAEVDKQVQDVVDMLKQGK